MTSWTKKAFDKHKHIQRAIYNNKRHGGLLSIKDVIESDWTINDKIAYIRHKYIWYAGNYELFHDENGKYNINKLRLNAVIRGIIDGKIDPGVLNEVNNIIKQWNKEYKQKKIKEEQDILDKLPYTTNITIKNKIEKEIELRPRYLVDIQRSNISAKLTEYLKIIDEYIAATPEKERKQLYEMKYQTIKKRALNWQKANTIDSVDAKKAFKRLVKGYNKHYEQESKNESIN